jgi:hypothetical protein
MALLARLLGIPSSPPPHTARKERRRQGVRQRQRKRDRALVRESGGKEKERKVEFENSLLVYSLRDQVTFTPIQFLIHSHYHLRGSSSLGLILYSSPYPLIIVLSYPFQITCFTFIRFMLSLLIDLFIHLYKIYCCLPILSFLSINQHLIHSFFIIHSSVSFCICVFLFTYH